MPYRPTRISKTDAGRVLNAVLDAGINYINTAIDYGNSEEFIGSSIAHRRSEYIIASTCGCVPGERHDAEHVHTRANVRRGVEHSLRTLKTDYLDVVQFHQSLRREEFNAVGAMDELMALRDEGKVRFIGVSTFLPRTIEHVAMSAFDVFQIPYSALQRDHEEVITEASDAGIGIVVRGGIARGTPEDWQGRRYTMVPNETLLGYWEQARLDELRDGMSRTAFMLRFTLSNPSLDTTIVGTVNLEHLQDNVAAAVMGPLPDDVVAEAKRRLTAVGARGSHQ